jgi:hypothetical protein
MIRIFRPASAPEWLLAVVQSIERAFAEQALDEYRVAELPAASGRKRMVFVADEVGGPVVAFNDGSDWRRVTDRAIVA